MKWVTRERPKIDRLACPWDAALARLAEIWCRTLEGERHGWRPQTVLTEMSW